MEITLYRWSKYRNSTKQPPESAEQVTVTGEFKTGYTILHPVLKLSRTVQFMGAKNPYWNYAYSDTTHYYYFVRNWVYESGFWVAYLDYDPLASWKSQILDKNYYVLRSSSDYNGDIPDNTYPTTGATPTITTSNIPNFPWLDLGNGCYIMAVVNDLGNSSGAITYYVIEPQQMSTLFTKLLSSISWANISATEISQQLQKALINPLQYIVSLQWLPYASSDILGKTNRELRVGWWTIDNGDWPTISSFSSIATDSFSLSIPKHPSTASRGNYLNLSPYTKYQFTMYPFGTFDIDTTDLIGYSTLYGYVDTEPLSGVSYLFLSTGSKNNAFRKIRSQIGVQIPLAQINVNLAALTGGTSLITAGVAGASAAAASVAGSPNLSKIPANTQNPNAARARAAMLRGEIDYAGSDDSSSVADVAAAIGNAALAALSNVEYHPASPSFKDLQIDITLTGRFLGITAGYPSYIGRPLCAYRTLRSLSGFCKCHLAWPDLAGATMQEQEDIASYLNGGFYIE